MAILIKGKKKPPKCEWVNKYHDVCRCVMLDGEDNCVLQDCEEEWTWSEQYANCPLVEVPDTQTEKKSPNGDLVSRKTVIEALWRDRQQADALMDKYLKNGYMALRADAKAERNRIEKDIAIVEGLPSAQPEIVRCKDCKFWREHKYAKETKRYIPFCGLNAIYTKSDDFCSKGERRTDEMQ